METGAQAMGHVSRKEKVIWKALIKPSNVVYVTGNKSNQNDPNVNIICAREVAANWLRVTY